MAPLEQFDPGLQPERTSMAWERTGFSLIAAGAVLARYSLGDGYIVAATVGLAVSALGVVVLAWSGRRYNVMHQPLTEKQSPVHPTAARLIGLTTMACAATALIVSAIQVY